MLSKKKKDKPGIGTLQKNDPEGKNSYQKFIYNFSPYT